MVYAWTQDVPIGADLYGRIVERLGDEPMDGLLLHLAVRNPDGGLRYIDVWASEQQCDRAVEDRVHPAVHAAFRDAGQPFPPVEPARNLLDVLEIRGAVTGGVPA